MSPEVNQRRFKHLRVSMDIVLLSNALLLSLLVIRFHLFVLFSQRVPLQNLMNVVDFTVLISVFDLIHLADLLRFLGL